QDAMTMQPTFWHSRLFWLCMLAGPLTLSPLILFNVAAKQLPYSTIGFLQYLSPTLIFLLAVFHYGEPFDLTKVITFAFIWTALVIFTLDTFLGRKRGKEMAIDDKHDFAKTIK